MDPSVTTPSWESCPDDLHSEIFRIRPEAVSWGARILKPGSSLSSEDVETHISELANILQTIAKTQPDLKKKSITILKDLAVKVSSSEPLHGHQKIQSLSETLEDIIRGISPSGKRDAYQVFSEESDQASRMEPRKKKGKTTVRPDASIAPASIDVDMGTESSEKAASSSTEAQGTDPFSHTIERILRLKTELLETTDFQKQLEIFTKIRSLLSTTMAASTRLTREEQHRRIEAISKSVGQTLCAALAVGEGSPSAHSNLIHAVFEWMRTTQNSELINFIKTIIPYYIKNPKTIENFLREISSFVTLPMDSIKESLIQAQTDDEKRKFFNTFLEKNLDHILEEISHKLEKVLTFDKLVDSLSGQSEILFSILQPHDRTAFMQTCQLAKSIGTEFLAGSPIDAIKYLQSLDPKKPFRLEEVPSGLRNNFLVVTYALILDINNYQYLDPKFQNDIEIQRVVVLSYMQSPSDEKRKLYDMIPEEVRNSPDMQRRIEQMQKTEFPNQIFWKRTGVFFFAGFSRLPEILNVSIQSLASVLYAEGIDIDVPQHMVDNTEYLNLMYTVFGSMLLEKNPFIVKNREFFKKVLSMNGLLLQYGTPAQKEDEELVKVAVKQSGRAIMYASDICKAKKSIALLAVQQDGLILGLLPENLRADKDIVLAAVKQNGLALQFAKKDFFTDRDVILAAVKQNGKALYWASLQLREDVAVVTEAVKQDGSALIWASLEVRGNRNVVLEAVKQNGLALRSASAKLKGDREVVLQAVKQNGRAILYADLLFADDKEVVLAALRTCPRVLYSVSKRLKNDLEVVLTAVDQDGSLIEDASAELQENLEVVRRAVLQNKNVINLISYKVRCKQFWLQALYNLLYYVPDFLKK